MIHATLGIINLTSSFCCPAAHALHAQTPRPLQDTCICVLGGNGFIGSRLVELLTQHAPAAGAGPSSTSSAQVYEHSRHLPNAQSIGYGGRLGKKQLEQEQLEKQSGGYRLVMSMDPRNTTRTLLNGEAGAEYAAGWYDHACCWPIRRVFLSCSNALC